MPGPSVWAARKLFLKFGWPAVKIVVGLIGADELARVAWQWLLRTTGTHPDRRKAIRRAEQVDGLIGSVLLDDGAHWVVFSNDQPVVAYPRFDGDLGAALRDYRRDQLRSPGALPSRRAQAWFKARIPAFVKRADDASDGTGGPGASGTEEVKRVVDQLEPLLARLTASPKAKLADHPSIPAAPGIYLFSEGPNPIYVGQAADLKERLRQPTEASSPQSPRVADMNVQFIELDDPMTRTIFEVYAARVLGTDELNPGEPVGGDGR